MLTHAIVSPIAIVRSGSTDRGRGLTYTPLGDEYFPTQEQKTITIEVCERNESVRPIGRKDERRSGDNSSISETKEQLKEEIKYAVW